jgi:hypothetical protein
MNIDCSKAKQKARWLRYLIVAVMLLLVLGNIVLAWPGGWDISSSMFDLTRSITGPLANHPRLFLIENALVSLVYLAGLYRLVRLMRLFEQGEFFSVLAVAHLRAFALSLLLATVVGCALPALELWVAHLMGSEHVTAIAVAVDSSDLWQGFISALFFVVAVILGEARQLAEDNQLIV